MAAQYAEHVFEEGLVNNVEDEEKDTEGEAENEPLCELGLVGDIAIVFAAETEVECGVEEPQTADKAEVVDNMELLAVDKDSIADNHILDNAGRTVDMVAAVDTTVLLWAQWPALQSGAVQLGKLSDLDLVQAMRMLRFDNNIEMSEPGSDHQQVMSLGL